MTGGPGRRRDKRYDDRSGERRSHGRGWEQALPEGRVPALPGEERRHAGGASNSVTG